MISTCELSEPKPKRVFTAEQRHARAEYSRTHRQTASHKNATLLRKYGIDLEQWNEMFAAQGRRCAICSTDSPTSKKGWATDHCHTTGHVRGILCSHCNVMLGMSAENPDTLLKAVEYLGKQNG